MAAPASVTYDLDNIATSTMRIIRPRIADTIFKANQTAAWLLSNGRVRTESGGRWIEEPLMYRRNDTIRSYRGYDRLNVAPTEEFTAARYNWRQAAGSVAISGLEDEIQNAGAAQRFDLLKKKLMVLELSFQEWFDEQLHAATTSKDLSRDFLGLQQIIDGYAGAAQGTLGGIDKDTYTWWANQYSRPSTTIWERSQREMTQAMITFLNNCSKGLSRTDLILTTQELFEWYEKENHDLLRLSPNDLNMLSIGFVAQSFKGIRMMWNENLPDADRFMYFLNSKYLSFVLHAARNFAMTPFVKPYDQDAKVAQMLLAGQLTCSNCRFQGVMELDQITLDPDA